MSDNLLVAAIAKYGDITVSFAIAAFFGLIRYLQDFVGPEPPAFRGLVAAAKILTAGAAGMLVHWLVVEWKVSSNFSAFLVAIAGYGGAESINAMKEAWLEYIRRKAASPPGPGPAG